MAAKTRKFKAEMKQLMEIIVHSLYSHKEIFLRELISNAVDAIDKARFQGLTDPSVLEDNADWKVRLEVDEAASTLSVIDNGLGMSVETITEQLGSIAKSGTKEFLAGLEGADAANRPELIGQFGVGFYSAFMVADKVEVESRMAGDPKEGVRWTSDGGGTYTIETIDLPQRGTTVRLHLRENEKEFLDAWRIREIVKRFSDFVEHPIVMEVDKPKYNGDDEEPTTERVEETLNSGQAIWLRPKSEIKDEEYTEFFKHIARASDEPAKTIHYVAEGNLEFRALLFLPGKRPPSFLMDDPTKQGPHLYVKRVFITDNAEALLPPYLRFVRGVVDTSDLPLNVSRELLQDNPVATRIQKALVNKVLQTLEEMAAEEPEAYDAFFKEWGTMLKMGSYTDFGNRERLAELLRFESTATAPGTYTTLAKYVAVMDEKQKEIFYLLGPNRDVLEKSPYLEVFKAREQEVLLMTEPVDEWVASSLMQYKEKPLKAVDKGELEGEDKEAREANEKQFEGLLKLLGEMVPEVKQVRLSGRLKDSAAVLVVDEGALNAHMQSILQSMGQTDLPENTRNLELNAEHPTILAMQGLFEKKPDDPRLTAYARLLYDQAVLAEGSRVADPQQMAARINELIAKDAAPTD
jgi:molecular chaperone HtpG